MKSRPRGIIVIVLENTRSREGEEVLDEDDSSVHPSAEEEPISDVGDTIVHSDQVDQPTVDAVISRSDAQIFPNPLPNVALPEPRPTQTASETFSLIVRGMINDRYGFRSG